jgi:two-component system chemotaxis response regulator CheY
MTLRALLVEDSRAMRAYVASILEAAGFEVTECDNGFEALRVLPRGGFGLVIADVNMPDVSGIEVTRFVRRTVGYERTPVVVISTDASEEDRRRVIAAGANAFLAKPFTADELVAVLERARGGPSGEPA